MEFLSHPVVALIVLLGVLVLFHELGHYLVGRWSGIAVEIFAIGFGPPLFRFRRHHTEYRIGSIPLGGFVKFYGSVPAELVPDELQGKEYCKASWQKRALTVAAGPVANFLLAVAAFTVLGYVGVKHPPAIVGEIRPDSPAEKAGLMFMDEITSIDGQSIGKWGDLEKQIRGKAGQKIEITLKREGELLTVELTPEATEITDYAGRQRTVGRAGIALARHPSVVTIVTSNSDVAASGLETGDVIQEVQFAGEVRSIEYWREFVSALWAAKNIGVNQVVLQVKKSKTTTSQSIVLPLPKTEVNNPRQLVEVLGLRDSQLTIASSKDELSGVLQKGDVLLSLNGETIVDLYDLSRVMESLKKPSTEVTVLRNGKRESIPATMKSVEVQAPQGRITVFTMPVTMMSELQTPPYVVEKYSNPVAALGYGAKETVKQSWEILSVLGHLIIGEVPLKALGGPILIAKVAGESAKRGWETFVSTLALISINLGLINLFPIPVLDGGQLVLISAEAVRRRPLSESAMENFQKVGFVMIMSLVVLATYNDISRFWTSMLESVVGTY